MPLKQISLETSEIEVYFFFTIFQVWVWLRALNSWLFRRRPDIPVDTEVYTIIVKLLELYLV